MPRKGAPAPTDADDRFDDSRHPRRTLASNGCDRREPASRRSGEGFIWALASRATHKRADGAKSLPDADGAYARGARPQSVTAVPLLAISETLARRRSRPAFAFARVSRADANAWLPMSPSAVACDACADVASVIASSDERARRGPSRSWLLSREGQADCPALVGVSEVGEPRRMRAAVSRPPGRVRSVSRDGAAGGAEA